MWPGLVSLSQALPANHTRMQIRGGYLGTLDTINQMQQVVTDAKRNCESARAVAIKIAQDCPNKDFSCYVQRVYEYVASMRYCYDVNGVETIQRPEYTLRVRGGDCDDFAVCLCAILESIGIPCNFVTIKANAKNPDDFTHVYAEAIVPGKGPIPMDATMPEKGFAWKPPALFGVKRWPSSLDEREKHGGDSMSGLNGIGCGCGGGCSTQMLSSPAFPSMMGALNNCQPMPLAQDGRDDVDTFDYSGDDSNAGLSGLGDVDQGILETIENIFNGTTASDLRYARNELNRQLSVLLDLRNDALAQGNSAALSDIAAARNIAMDGNLKITAAQNQYNFIVGELARIPGVDAPGPLTLSALGLAPAVIAAIGIGTAIGIAAAGLAVLVGQIGGAIHGGDGYIQQISSALGKSADVAQSVGKAATDIGTVLIVGGLAYAGYLFLKKKGKL